MDYMTTITATISISVLCSDTTKERAAETAKAWFDRDIAPNIEQISPDIRYEIIAKEI